ncbi:MAG: alpha/beta hydrolase family protein [Limisphaerales bacterium]
MKSTLRNLLGAGALLATMLSGGSDTGLWDLGKLADPPPAEWGSRTGLVQEVHYAGEPLAGRPTRVFAYLGRPVAADPAERRPAMVLVHGGGGKAFSKWAEHWAERGYVALAMDLAGNGPSGRLPDGGPDQSDSVKFREFGVGEEREMWSYHAVAAVIRGNSLVRSLPDVDPERVGITGISWGGYLTCLAASVDPRFKVAVPVYGCGFLGDNSVWKDKSLAAMSADARGRWLALFDPGNYLGRVSCPILFLNGTTDFAYPLDSYQKSYRQVPARWRHVSVVVDLPHGHIWTFPEVDAFVDSHLRDSDPLLGLGQAKYRDGVVRSAIHGSTPVRAANLHFTTDSGPWQKRTWKTRPARIVGGAVEVELPEERPWVGYLSVTDERGLRTSGEHFSLGIQSAR